MDEFNRAIEALDRPQSSLARVLPPLLWSRLAGPPAARAVWSAANAARGRLRDSENTDWWEFLRRPPLERLRPAYDVLLVSNALLPVRGGGTRSLLHLGAQLAASGLAVAAVCLGPAVARFQHRGIDVIWIVHEDDLADCIAAIPARRVLGQQAWALPAARAAQRLGRPFWFFLRSVEDLAGAAGDNLFDPPDLAAAIQARQGEDPAVAAATETVAAAERVIANSGFIAAVVQAAFGATADVVYPGIDPPEPWEQERSHLSRAVLAMAGTPKKGIQIIIQLAAMFPETPFLVCGVKSPQTSARRKFPPNLHWAGTLPPPAAYALAAAVLEPSQWAEPAGRVGAEALVRGLPLLASRAGGIPEIVHDDQFLVTDFANPAAWRRALRALRKANPAPVRARALELGARYLGMQTFPDRLLHALRD